MKQPAANGSEVSEPVVGRRESRIYRKARIPLRSTLAYLMPGPLSPARRIAVTGIARSGTSWLAKCISLASGVTFYFEPDEPCTRDCRHLHVPPDEDNPHLERAIRRMWSGRVVGDRQIAEKGIRDLLATPFARTVLVKWVWLSFSLEWIAARFPDVRMVQLVRHPIAQFLSWRDRGWSPRMALDRVLEQPELARGPLGAHLDVLRGADGFWETASAFWGAAATMQLAAQRPGWILREHEWYCLEPERRIRWLVEELGLEWTDSIEEFLSPNRVRRHGPGYGHARDPRTEVHKWESRVTAAEVRLVAGVVQEFNLPFYPELDPERSWLDRRL